MNNTSGTNDCRNITPQGFRPGDVEYTVVLSVFTLLALVGVVGGTAMIVVLLHTKRSAFHVILIGMSCADILSACNSPLHILVSLSSSNFTLPTFLCPMTFTLDHATSIVTLGHVLLLSYMRYQSIVVKAITPHRDKESATKQYTLLVVISWLLSGLLSIPVPFSVAVVATPKGMSCGGRLDVGAKTKFVMASFTTIGIIIPVLLIVGFCSVLLLFLKNRKSPASKRSASQRKESNAVKQLMAIVVTVLLAYSCDYGSKLYLMAHWGRVGQRVKMFSVLASHGMLRITECINPIIYYLGSNELQKTVKSVCIIMRRRITADSDCSDNPTKVKAPQGISMDSRWRTCWVKQLKSHDSRIVTIHKPNITWLYVLCCNTT